MRKFLILGGLFIVIQMFIACHANQSAKPSNHTPNSTEIQWEKTSLDLGKITMGDTARFYFAFENTGQHPLIVSEKEKTCGCILVTAPANPVMPGKKDSVQVAFITRLSITGWQRKSFRISTNTPVPQQNLYFTAEINGHK
ncbi:MAG: DUF1573 domain-containing protein [Chitinophagia bacterium]|nr:DUF1573 domain-containing protein [Chitinophagia bacterium]